LGLFYADDFTLRFPTLRVSSQRNGNVKEIYTHIQNLDRVRVVVDEKSK